MLDKNSIYYKQVQLLLEVLPYVSQEECFALKGGTAINMLTDTDVGHTVAYNRGTGPVFSPDPRARLVEAGIVRFNAAEDPDVLHGTPTEGCEGTEGKFASHP